MLSNIIEKFSQIHPSDNAKNILKERYFLKNQSGEYIEHSWSDVAKRVARVIATAEVLSASNKNIETVKIWEKSFYSILNARVFIPNSPTLFNAGTGVKIELLQKPIDEMTIEDYEEIYKTRNHLHMLSACFVIPVDDSIEGIFDAVKNYALITKVGGGVGSNFSSLRPKGAFVAGTSGRASGPVSFMHVFNSAISVVEQGYKRRGALMGILDIDHPDIEEFIEAKKDNTGESILKFFNISVGIKNKEKIIEAYESDGEIELSYPKSGIVKSIKIRELLRKIAENAWKTGDPGLAILSEMNKYNALYPYRAIESTNPCITGDTFVQTINGPKQVFDLIGKKINLVVNGEAYQMTSNGFFSSGKKEIFNLKTHEGYALKLTKNHPVLKVKNRTRYSIETEWSDAGDLKKGDEIILNNHRKIEKWIGKYGEKTGYMLGLFVGEGTFANKEAPLEMWAVDKDDDSESVMNKTLEYAMSTSHRIDFKDRHTMRNTSVHTLNVKDLAQEMGIIEAHKTITSKIEMESFEFYQGFLRGIFDSNGDVQGGTKKGALVKLPQSDFDLLEKVQRMLLRMGIVSRIYRSRNKSQHELVISKDNLFVFSQLIGFEDKTKRAKLNAVLDGYVRKMYKERFVVTVESMEKVGIEDVYDVSVEKIHAFDANGLVVHNCGEIGLPPYEACNLGSIDVAKFYDGGSFDHQAFDETAKIAIRFLDNVIDVNVFPLKEIEEAVRNSRRLGLGIMGFADLLYKMGISYDSEEAFKFASNLMAELALESHKASYELGVEKGNFPFYDHSKYAQDGGFIPFAMGASDIDEKLRDEFKEISKAHRNVAVMTVAPTGSISNIADTSSGLEPNFLLAYTRYMNKSDGTKESLLYANNILAEKLGDTLDDEMKKKIMEEGTIKHIDAIPDEIKSVFVVSHDISTDAHLKMQEAFQNYVDNNISKTINMSNASTVDDILEVYIRALKSNVRGITIYRDGSLQMQVLNANKNVKTKDAPKVNFFVIDEHHKLRARPRKKTLRSVTRKYKGESSTTYITVSFDDSGEAIEVFVSDGGETAEIIGRLSSIALRAGVSMDEILEQLKKVKGDYSHGVAEEIKKAIDDFSELWGGNVDEDGTEEIIHLDGTRKSPEEIEKFVVANNLKWYNDYYIDEDGNTYCPVCLSKNSIINQEGCVTCMNCNWSKCVVG